MICCIAMPSTVVVAADFRRTYPSNANYQHIEPRRTDAYIQNDVGVAAAAREGKTFFDNLMNHSWAKCNLHSMLYQIYVMRANIRGNCHGYWASNAFHLVCNCSSSWFSVASRMRWPLERMWRMIITDNWTQIANSAEHTQTHTRARVAQPKIQLCIFAMLVFSPLFGWSMGRFCAFHYFQRNYIHIVWHQCVCEFVSILVKINSVYAQCSCDSVAHLGILQKSAQRTEQTFFTQANAINSIAKILEKL